MYSKKLNIVKRAPLPILAEMRRIASSLSPAQKTEFTPPYFSDNQLIAVFLTLFFRRAIRFADIRFAPVCKFDAFLYNMLDNVNKNKTAWWHIPANVLAALWRQEAQAEATRDIKNNFFINF